MLEDASKEQSKFLPQPIWKNFLALFRAIDRGNDRLAIWAYNGGLFAEDKLADTLVLPDPLAQDVARLGQWDYRREVPVTILGHIFEQSITDIEKLKAEGKGEAPPAVSKRKRAGIVYTPDMVTRFLVERTVALSLDDRRAALWSAHGMEAEKPRAQRAKSLSGRPISPFCATSPLSIRPAAPARFSSRRSMKWRAAIATPRAR